jgi:hypothetical protein
MISPVRDGRIWLDSRGKTGQSARGSAGGDLRPREDVRSRFGYAFRDAVFNSLPRARVSEGDSP